MSMFLRYVATFSAELWMIEGSWPSALLTFADHGSSRFWQMSFNWLRVSIRLGAARLTSAWDGKKWLRGSARRDDVCRGAKISVWRRRTGSRRDAPTVEQDLEREISCGSSGAGCRVAGRGHPRPAPSEPCMGLSIHTAQASAKASFDTRFHNCISGVLRISMATGMV
jgi:hypothetical protein